MEFILITLLNGVSYGLLLFMLSSGLTLVFSMMGVLNFAHAGFYMLGAYLGYAVGGSIGFWPALLIVPLAIGLFGAAVEVFGLRQVRGQGHVAELLFTFGLSYLILEAVQLVWGRAPVSSPVPAALEGPLFTVYGMSFPTYRGFMMGTAIVMLIAMHLLLARTRIGLVVRAALTHPSAVQALGHNVPRIFTLVFGVGCALAGLAGVVGGRAFVTEPSMAIAMGSVVFVVIVVGGLGSLSGALWASLAIGIVQTFAVALDHSLLGLLASAGLAPPAGFFHSLLGITIAQMAPVLPYFLMVAVLLLRPAGMAGNRTAG